MAESVFISYAWEDDKPFVRRLHKDLTENGFKVWWDRTSLKWDQRPFRQEIADAIRSHDRLILVVGPKAAASPSVRQEWQWALALDKPVIPILRQGDHTLLPGELSIFQCDDFRNDAQYRAQLARLIESLLRPEPPLGALSGVLSLPPHFLARPELLRQVKDTLLMDLKTPVVITGADARVGMHGMGGIGKSVLATAIARDREVRRSYPDGIIWITVGQKPNLVVLQHDVARHLGSKEHFDTEAQGQGVLRQLLMQKSVLLVLDDVWQASHTQAFDVLGPHCRALVTTRDAGILHTLGGPSVSVALLTEQEALQLLADAVAVEPSALPARAIEVVKECGYLPVAVVLCGSMVKKLGGDWTVVLERLRAADLEHIADRQAIDKRHRSIWRTMQVSVDSLSSDEQRRFAELAVFARDNPVPEAAVATLWSHTGNLSDIDTTDLLINLADRSLIRLHQKPATPGEPVERYISLHDLLCDFATRLAGESQALNRALLAAYRKLCTRSWASGPNDGYFYQHLGHHLCAAGRQRELSKLLFDYRWLRSRLKATDSNALMADYDLIGDDAQAKLVQGAIRLSSHTLADDASHLPSQLYGRLASQKGTRIKVLLTSILNDSEGVWLRPLTATLPLPGGPLLRTLRGHKDWVEAVALTRDGRYVVSGSRDHTLKVWDLGSDKAVRTLRCHEDSVRTLAVTDDGRYAVVPTHWTLEVWDLAFGTLVRSLRHEGYVLAVAVTGDGHYAVASSEDGILKVWDLASGKAIRALRGHGAQVNALVVTDDGRCAVSASDDKTLKVWDLLSGKAVHTLRGHEDAVTVVAMTGDARYVLSGSRDHTLKIWDLALGKVVRTMLAHEYSVEAVAITRDGHYAVSASGDALKLWDLGLGEAVRTLCGQNVVVTLAITPDGRHVVSGSWDRTVRVWDLAPGKAVRTPRGHEGAVHIVVVTADGRCAVSGSEAKLEVWDLASGKALRGLQLHKGRVRAATVTGDGHYGVLCFKDGILRIWDLASGKVASTLYGSESERTSVMVTADGRYVVQSSHDGTPKVWDLASGEGPDTLRAHEGWIRAVAVTCNGHYALSGWDHALKVWDLASGKVVHTLRGPKGWRTAMATTADGRYVVQTSDRGTAKVWDLASCRSVRTPRGQKGVIRAVAVTPDGHHAILGSEDGTLTVWDLASGKVIHTLLAHQHWVRAVAVTPDGHCAISGSDDQTLKVWDLSSGQIVAGFCGDSEILCCAIAPDKRTIIAGERSGRVHCLRLENVK